MEALTQERTKRILSKKSALLLSISVTLAAMVVEFVYGVLLNSVMLKSDAIHMLSHALALLIALFAILYTKNLSEEKAKKVEALSAFTNALLIFAFVLWIVVDAGIKFMHLEEMETSQLLWVAIFGLGVNLLTALILSFGGIEDLNTKGAFLHLLADTFSSIAIIVGAYLTQYFHWFWLDPVLSLVIAFVVAKWGVGLMKESTKVLLTEK
ncbi:cation diffusion facilitator family transporter [Lishizhenia sp.]|uniref:cation diffusion facilitator family transporter n=1 Tax=Lishizhenia sp. TaxID=2497594 RepID=UPI00299D7E47|nr:cation diffusion facilitator family transporter [Lishizhenia sp.]MDX1444785.1 cation diffusion facilitator family transporter [Lishizhenia sp.]